MKNIIYITIYTCLITITSFNFSCKKEEGAVNRPANGKVIDKETLTGIANAEVLLIGQRSDCWTCPSFTLGLTTTNSEGDYFINYEIKNKIIYSVTSNHPDYFPEYNTFSLKKGKTNIYLDPINYLIINVKNNPPIDTIWDQLHLWTSSYVNVYFNQFMGGLYDTTIVSKVYRNQTHYIGWQYQGHLINYGEFRDSIKCINKENYYYITW